MLRRVAWRMQEAPDGLRANAMTEADLLGVLEEFFRDDWHLDVPKTARAAREMEQRLQERNWVVTLRGPGLYGFVHRTFLEYLCATEIAEQFKAQRIDAGELITRYVSGRLQDDSWHEVLRLLVGLLPLAAAERVIAAIVPGEGELPLAMQRLGLAWQALAELEHRHIASLGEVCGALTDRLYQWLQAPGPGAAVRDGEEHDYYEKAIAVAVAITEAGESIGSTVWPVSHPPERKWPELGDMHFGNITYIFQREATGVVAALGKAIWNRSDATTVWLRARAVDDPDVNVRSAALDALAQHFRDERRTGQLLRARAVDDPDAGARNAAFVALAQHFRDEPEHRPAAPRPRR